MQVASTIVASGVAGPEMLASTGPNETVRVTEAQSPWRRPVAAMVARRWISAALKVGLAEAGQAVVAGDAEVDRDHALADQAMGQVAGDVGLGLARA